MARRKSAEAKADWFRDLCAELGEPVEQAPGEDYPAWYCRGRANGHFTDCPLAQNPALKEGCTCESET